MINQVVFSQNNYELLYLNGDFEQILSTAEKRSTVEDCYWYSFILNKQGKTLEAIEILEEELFKFKENKSLELLISNFYYEAGSLLKAKPYLEKYQENPEIFMQLIKTFEFENNNKLAIELLDKKIAIDSMNIQYLTHLGDNYYQIDSFGLALVYYDKILTLNPNDQLTANKLANLYFKIKNYEKSIEICDLVLINDSTNKKFIKTKGISSFNKKDFKTAETCLNYIYNNGDSSKFILKHLGISEFNNYLFVTSRKHLLMAYELDTND